MQQFMNGYPNGAGMGNMGPTQPSMMMSGSRSPSPPMYQALRPPMAQQQRPPADTSFLPTSVMKQMADKKAYTKSGTNDFTTGAASNVAAGGRAIVKQGGSQSGQQTQENHGAQVFSI